MLVGAFGPWLKATAAFVGTITVSGTDGSNDGWVVVVLALAGGLLLYSALLASRRIVRIVTGLLALAAGVGALATTIYDRNKVSLHSPRQ